MTGTRKTNTCLACLTFLATFAIVTPASATNEPVTGRWLTRDPIGYEGGSFNLYEYVNSQPTFWLDSFGLEAWKPTAGWTGENIKKLKDCIKNKIENWIKCKDTCQDCADTALRALVECAKELGLPLTFKVWDSDKKTYIYISSSDDEFTDLKGFLKNVQDKIATINLADNTTDKKTKELEPGDLVISLKRTKNTTGHTMVVLKNDPEGKKVTIGEGHYAKDPKTRKPVSKRDLPYSKVDGMKGKFEGGREWDWKILGGKRRGRP